MKLQIKKFNRFTDITGSLVPFYKNKSLNNPKGKEKVVI